STITVVTSSCTLALHIKRLVQNVREQDENAKDLGDRLDTLTTILGQAGALYGSDETRTFSPSEQQIRNCVDKVVRHCEKDLRDFKEKLEDLVHHGNWISVAWKQQVAAPKLARIEKTLSVRQQHLSILMEIIHGHQLHHIYGILQTLAVKSTIHTPFSMTNADQAADTASMISQVTTLIEEQEEEEEEGQASQNSQKTQKDPQSNQNGTYLLKAIQDGDNDTFESLLLDPGTSLQHKDDKDRNALLLAASLGKAGMVKRLLAIDAEGRSEACKEGCPGFKISWDLPTDAEPPSLLSSQTSYERCTQITSHRKIDLMAIDKLGRTALHYCAEFDLCDEAKLLLENGVDVNARDNLDLPPAYFAAKTRKYNVMKLLVSDWKAMTDFKRPTSTSSEIERLLGRTTNNDQLSPPPMTRSASSRQNSDFEDQELAETPSATITSCQFDYIFAIGTFFALLDAYNNGANDVANAWATSVSSRSISYRWAMVCATVFELLGATLVGARTA
ncbi:MAG: hypothetical protein Q9219_007012, partial [cf. Caloplaca sp. 3 TL-2023]